MYLIEGKEYMYEYVYSLKELYSIIVFSSAAKLHIKVYCTVNIRLPLSALIKKYDNFKKSYQHNVDN